MKMKLHITSSIFDFCNISATANALAKFETRFSKFTENNCTKLYSILALKYPFEQNGGTILILKHFILPPKWILCLQKKITSQWLGIFILISLIDSKTEIYFQKTKCIWNYFTCSKLTIETLEQCMKHDSNVFTVNFEHTLHLALLLLLTLSR